MTALSYLVLRCADIELSRRFYKALGFELTAEKHGNGPEHYSMRIGDVVMELYPVGAKLTSGVRIGCHLDDPTALSSTALVVGGELVSTNDESVVLRDPDGHTIELMREVSP